MAWNSFEIGMQLRQGRGCVRLCSAQLYYVIGAFAVAGNSRGHLRNGGAFLTCSEGQDYQQLSELWFRQSVCWRQLTAAAQAASSLTRIRRVAVRFWRQATCICHLLEQFFNRRGSRNRLRARGPRSQGHVPQKFGMHPTTYTHRQQSSKSVIIQLAFPVSCFGIWRIPRVSQQGISFKFHLALGPTSLSKRPSALPAGRLDNPVQRRLAAK